MDLATQSRVVNDLVKLSEQLDGICGALVAATQRGLVVGNLRAVVLTFRDELAQAVQGTV